MDLLIVGTEMTEVFAANADLLAQLFAPDDVIAGFELELFRKHWPTVATRTLLDPFRAHALAHYLVEALALEGDIIECGVFRGGSALLMALILRDLGVDRKVLMLDSFEGLPAPQHGFDGGYRQGQFRASVTELRAHVSELGLDAYCDIRPGWFADTLPSVPKDSRLCLAHIDCDLYEPAGACLRALYPMASAGAPLIIDDYHDGSGGAMRALHEHCAQTAEVIQLGPAPQVAVLKGVTRSPHSFVSEAPDSPVLSTARLQKQRHYLRFLRELRAHHQLQLDAFDDFISLCAGA